MSPFEIPTARLGRFSGQACDERTTETRAESRTLLREQADCSCPSHVTDSGGVRQACQAGLAAAG
jgi:hypothetical protein